MRTYGVPWQAPLARHPLHTIINTIGSKGFVSVIYGFLLDSSYGDLPVDSIWRRDIPDLVPDWDWDTVWTNIVLSSRNPDHQQIHLNFVHRTYLTPRRLCAMKLINSPLCTLCATNSIGSFYHMVWECPNVFSFWKMVATKLSELLDVEIPPSPAVLLLNDDSKLQLNKTRTRVFFAGLTAAKKMVATRWKPPHVLTFRQWALTFLDIIYLEWSTARLHGAKEENVNIWSFAAEIIKQML